MVQNGVILGVWLGNTLLNEGLLLFAHIFQKILSNDLLLCYCYSAWYRWIRRGIRLHQSRWVGGCNSITKPMSRHFTDWSIFRIPFLWWKRDTSGPVTQSSQLVSRDWEPHSREIRTKNKWVYENTLTGMSWNCMLLLIGSWFAQNFGHLFEGWKQENAEKLSPWISRKSNETQLMIYNWSGKYKYLVVVEMPCYLHQPKQRTGKENKKRCLRQESWNTPNSVCLEFRGGESKKNG